MINFALILDSIETLGLEHGDKSYIYDTLKDRYKTDYKTVLECSIRFIRVFNNVIVKKSWKSNGEERETHRGVCARVFGNMEIGGTYR